MVKLKLPFGNLWFRGLSAEGGLVFCREYDALVLPSREDFADYLPAEVPLSMFVLVEVPNALD